MYIVKLDNDFFAGFGKFYRPDHDIFSPELELEINAVGHFYFTVYPSHLMYDEIDKPKKIISVIRHNEKEPLFVGRVSSVEMGFHNEKIITCESELAFLLDSVRTNPYQSVQHTAAYWLDRILQNHNTNNDRFGSIYSSNIIRKFEAGNISKSLAEKTPFMVREDFEGTYTSFDIIMKLLVNNYGGVLKIRHENGKNYIDWTDESELSACSQKIEFGSNLLDINKNIQMCETVTAIRPVGENVQADNESIPLVLQGFDASPYIENSDVKQAVNVKITADTPVKYQDCLYSEALVKKYGWIQREIKFDGVKDRALLAKMGAEYFKSVGENNSITVTAADLSRADNSIENFREGDFAIVNSEVHDIYNRKFLVRNLKLDLSDPSKSRLTFGSDNEGITGQIGGSVSYSGNVRIVDTTSGDISSGTALREAKLYTENRLVNKVDKVEGKGLSANDFTDAYKDKIDGIEDGANKTVVDSYLSDTSTNPVRNKAVCHRFRTIDDSMNAVQTKLDGIEAGANKTIVDTTLSETSTNPVQNKKVTQRFKTIDDIISAADSRISALENLPSGGGVTGVKGNAESSYRTGNVNLTPADIGAAAASHTHNYAGSSSAGGAANSAVRLAASRTINGVSFDGSADITIPRSNKPIYRAWGTNGTIGWVKICSITVKATYTDVPIRFLISQKTINQYTINVRFNNTGTLSNTKVNSFTLSSGSNALTGAKAAILKSSSSSSGVKFDLYVYKKAAYDIITVLDYTKQIQDGGANIDVVWETGFNTNSTISGAVSATDEGGFYRNSNTGFLISEFSGSGTASYTNAGLVKFSFLYMKAAWTHNSYPTVYADSIIPAAAMASGAGSFRKVVQSGDLKHTFTANLTSAGVFTLSDSHTLSTPGTLTVQLYKV